jgi:hypothetical protein
LQLQDIGVIARIILSTQPIEITQASSPFVFFHRTAMRRLAPSSRVLRAMDEQALRALDY